MLYHAAVATSTREVRKYVHMLHVVKAFLVVDDMVLNNSITMVVHLEGIHGIQRFLNTGGASPGNSKEIL